MRRQLPKSQEPVVKEGSLAEQVKDLIQLFTVRELHSMKRLDQQQQQHTQLPSLSGIEPSIQSSPVQSETDHCEILSQFFNWLMAQPNHSFERQRQILEPIRQTLMEDDWDIDRIRSPKDMTIEIWKDYGFPIGTLPRIREKIREFKQQRGAHHE
jgi:hypothetical protein